MEETDVTGTDAGSATDKTPSGTRIKDIVSGTMIAGTPEEVEAVQPFARQLLEDYGYPIAHLRTRPQWRVKARPSDRKKEYPVDIAVFSGPEHTDDNAYIIVECKKKTRRDGRSQLEDYLLFSRAELGVWFNGNERLFLRKIESKNGIAFQEIPNIPRYGERVEDIGLYQRDSLKPTHNLKSVFRAIRNYLAANAVGMTRDEALAQQLMNIIFCKIYDERFTRSDAVVTLRAGVEESANDVAKRAHQLFSNVVSSYSDVFDATDSLKLDDESIRYIVGELQPYSLMECDRDAVADAFETFIGPSLKGAQGQFFTPRNVVHLVQTLVDPKYNERVIDPACGSGGFLVEALRHIWREIESLGADLSWPESEINAEKQKAAIRNLRGIDKDEFLTKVAKGYMAILGDGRGGIFCENSLVEPGQWSGKTREEIGFEKFDVIMTNPPFGKKLKVTENATLKHYDLGMKWKVDKTTGVAEKTTTSLDGQTPQILFIERCLDLLKPGGRMGVILPESMLCNPSHRYIIQYILSRASFKAVVSLPEELFQPHTHAKTCAVLIEKHAPDSSPKDDHEIFMAVAKWCGHDSRGLRIPNDDLPAIISRLERYRAKEELTFDHLGFVIKNSEVVDNIYLPKYYNPELMERITALADTHDLLSLGELAEEGVIGVSTGDEIGKLAYGTGGIPFIRTSDIVNWEFKTDPKHGVSQEIYDEYASKQDVRVGDILMVRDGTYLVGTVGVVTELDQKILYQSHILKFTSYDHDRLHPYLLLALVSAPIVKEQIWSKRFTQDIIDTLGQRWREIIVPVPKDEEEVTQIIAEVKEAVESRVRARTIARSAVMRVAPHDDFDSDADYEFSVLRR